MGASDPSLNGLVMNLIKKTQENMRTLISKIGKFSETDPCYDNH
jgi:hypothetical protein